MLNSAPTRVLLAVSIATAILFAGQAAYAESFGSFVRAHKNDGPQSAIARAKGGGRWVAGFAKGESSEAAAVGKALRECNTYRQRTGVQASCKLYSVNGTKVLGQKYTPATTPLDIYEQSPSDIRKHLSEATSLDAIEGIWSVSLRTYGVGGSSEQTDSQRVAILIDKDSAGVEYVEVNLKEDGSFPEGAITAHFTRAANGRSYVSTQMDPSGSEVKVYFSLESPSEMSGRYTESLTAGQQVTDFRYVKLFPPALATSNAPRSPVESLSKVTGTCFSVTEKDYVLTAYHVIEGATSIQVRFENSDPLEAEIVRTSKSTDLALLLVQGRPQPFIGLAEPGMLSVGRRVFTFGFPVQQLLGNEMKFTEGVISSMTGLRGDSLLMQMTLPIQPGNSGGPVVTEDGRLAGVITSSMAIGAFLNVAGTLPQNINWAINVDYVRPLLGSGVHQKEELTRDAAIALTRGAVCSIEGVVTR